MRPGRLIRGPVSGLDVALTVTAVAFVSTTLVGMAVLRASPANPVGWILLAAGAALPLGMFVQVLSDATYVYGRPAIPGWWPSIWPAGLSRSSRCR